MVHTVRRIAKILGVLVAVLVLLAAGLIAAGWYELRANGRRIREQYVASLARIWPEFLQDQQLARTYPVLAPAARARDAGPFLNSRIGWDIDPKRLAAWRERFPGRMQSLTLDRTLVDQIPKDWVKSPPSLWQQLDFSWMAALLPFDHWDVETNSAWAEEPHGSWPNGFPLLHELVPWAKLRLAKGVATRNLAGAAAEVEHLGGCCSPPRRPSKPAWASSSSSSSVKRSMPKGPRAAQLLSTGSTRSRELAPFARRWQRSRSFATRCRRRIAATSSESS